MADQPETGRREIRGVGPPVATVAANFAAPPRTGEAVGGLQTKYECV